MPSTNPADLPLAQQHQEKPQPIQGTGNTGRPNSSSVPTSDVPPPKTAEKMPRDMPQHS